jgi:hypothetical protein
LACPKPGEDNVPDQGVVSVLAALDGEAGSPVTVVSLPGRRAAGGRPQGRP